jgi:hypothetical protein
MQSVRLLGCYGGQAGGKEKRPIVVMLSEAKHPYALNNFRE